MNDDDAMGLADIQRALHAALVGDARVEDAAASLGVDPRRLAIYARFVRHHVQTALESNLPVFASRAGAAWPEVVDAYFASHPPRHWALNRAAEAFPAFVEAAVSAGRYGWTPFETCLAQAEWTLYVALADPTPLPDPSGLTEAVVNPTLIPMQFPYPVAEVMLAHGRGERPPNPAPAPSIVFFFQSPETGNGRYQIARPELLFAVKAVDAGLTPEAAAEATGQPIDGVRAAYAAAAALGVVIEPA